MCGRFTLTTPTFAELAEALGLDPTAGVGEAYRPRFNVAPSDTCFIVRARRDAPPGESPHELVMADWGLVPYFAESPKDGRRPINARAETLATSPLFRGAFERRRCVVVADGFFEWARKDDTKTPYWIHPRSGGLMPMAGIYENWIDRASGLKVRTFAVVTTQANGVVAAAHDRMPVVLSPEGVDAWLRAPELDPDPRRLVRLLAPAPDDLLDLRRVSSHVNTPKNDDPACIAPATEDEPQPAPPGTQAIAKEHRRGDTAALRGRTDDAEATLTEARALRSPYRQLIGMAAREGSRNTCRARPSRRVHRCRPRSSSRCRAPRCVP